MAVRMHYDYISDYYYELQVCIPYPDFKEGGGSEWN